MNLNRNRTLAALTALVLVVAVGGYLVYDQFLRGDSVAPLALPSGAAASGSAAAAASAPPSAGDSAAATASTTTAATAPASATASPAPASPSSSAATGGGTAAALAGTWVVSEGSVAGYRVREKLAGLPAQNDAVGRTEDVTGEIVLAASGETLSVQSGSIEVNLTTLASDDSRRERRLQEMAIETARFPTTTFTLTGPVDVPADALNGATVEVTLAGDLTLHGVTKSVSIPSQARLLDDHVEVVGSLTFPFADFDIEPPNIAGFVTVEDEGTLEFLLILEKV